jgi:L-alanine-DL-glutamate epimerase-like enolase superfamily enzyme
VNPPTGNLEHNRDVIPIERVDVSTFTIPTDYPESDGTLRWDRTTIVVVHATAAHKTGMGYTYADSATADLIRKKLAEIVRDMDALAPNAAYLRMWQQIRNLGRPGICSMAISAVDSALWDLKARILNLPLVTLLGQVREGAEVYGSGGFTSYSDQQLTDQFSGWVKQGISAVKMKIGRDPDRDPERVRAARAAIGEAPGLFVDANGAYSRKQALHLSEIFARESLVSWFEEPVSSDDLDGLRLLRDHAPATMEIAAGEYGYDIFYFRRMLQAGAVDVQQADMTRCGGISGMLGVASLCQAHNLLLSCHTAPSLHCHIACAIIPFKNIEYFHDHVRIENMLFDGVPQLVNGKLVPDLSRPGNGMELKSAAAEKFAA